MNFTAYLLELAYGNQNPALISSSETVSYTELYQRVIHLSEYIQEEIGTSKNVLLLSDNNSFFVTAYLAVMLSGNVVVPIDTKASDADIIHYADKCEFPILLSQEKYSQKLKSLLPHTPIISDNVYLKLRCSEAVQFRETANNDVAAIIFTSGSTGEKKGVMLSHENLIENTTSIVQYLDLQKEDRVCVVLPFFYCYGLSLLHTHLKVGGSLVLSTHPFIGGALRDIDKYHCTGFAGVPSTYQILIANTKFLQEELPSLRYFTQAGGKLPNNFIKEIADAFPKKEFIVMYGATEATARMSYLPAHLCMKKLGSIGKGIPGVKLRVVSENRDINPGEVGEIIASGKNIMQGYFKDAVGTSEVIVDGWYHTGDLGTVDDEGYIYVVGRSKNIIKCGGFRVSPYEIEEELCKLPSVNDAVVVGYEDAILGEAIAAFICSSSSNTEMLKTDILQHCRKVFPSHKIPKYMCFVREFPLNSSNKVDREKLKTMIANGRGFSY